MGWWKRLHSSEKAAVVVGSALAAGAAALAFWPKTASAKTITSADTGKTISVRVGDTVKFALPIPNPTTGAQWVFGYDPSLGILQEATPPSAASDGSFTFHVAKAGTLSMTAVQMLPNQQVLLPSTTDITLVAT